LANGYELMRRSPIQRLEPLHFISAFVGGLFALFAYSVSAQNPSPTPAAAASPSEAEPVIVTGSQIPTQTAAEVGPNLVQVIDRYTISETVAAITLKTSFLRLQGSAPLAC